MGKLDQALGETSEHPVADGISLNEIPTALAGDELLAIAEQSAEEAAYRRGHFIRSIVLVIVLVGAILTIVYLVGKSKYAVSVFHANIWFILLSGVLGAS